MNTKTAAWVFAFVLTTTVVLLWARPIDAGPDADATRTKWMCSACGHAFELTARQAADQARRDGRILSPLICPKCSRRSAYRAKTCARCGSPYLDRNAPGASGRCPKCLPTDGPEAPPDRLAPERPARRTQDEAKKTVRPRTKVI